MPHGKPELTRVGKDERPAPEAVKRLVDHFDQDRKVFLSSDYKDEQLRVEFLDPFFTSLGWNMDNSLDTIRTRNRGSVPLFHKAT
jgi:hypothetical protein